MNKLVIASCFVIASGFAANATAQAAVSQSNQSSTPSSANQSVIATDATAIGTRPVPAPGDRDCLRDTGSHIPPPKGQCLPVSGRSYNRQDIQRTGQSDVAHALQQLDPSVQVIGN